MSVNIARYPSLDGLRAISIFLVVAQHFDSSHQFGEHTYLWRLQLGDMGVRIFFVLSGFLITSLLLSEHNKHGKIDVYKFYTRRFLRIFPAYYFYLIVLAIIGATDIVSIDLRDLIWPLLYLTNYFGSGSTHLFGHTWSLAVEQQFYLVWPILLITLGLRWAVVVAALFVFAAPIIRIFISLETPIPTTLWEHFEVAGDPLAVGCIFAMVRHKLSFIPLYEKLKSSFSVTIAIIILFILAAAKEWPLFWNGIGTVISNLLIVFVIDSCIFLDKSIYYRILNNRISVYLGTLSYSLYIWQQFFAYSQLTTRFQYSLLLTFAMAVLSYHFIEIPALRLKSNFSR